MQATQASQKNRKQAGQRDRGRKCWHERENYFNEDTRGSRSARRSKSNQQPGLRMIREKDTTNAPRGVLQNFSRTEKAGQKVNCALRTMIILSRCQRRSCTKRHAIETRGPRGATGGGKKIFLRNGSEKSGTQNKDLPIQVMKKYTKRDAVQPLPKTKSKREELVHIWKSESQDRKEWESTRAKTKSSSNRREGSWKGEKGDQPP